MDSVTCSLSSDSDSRHMGSVKDSTGTASVCIIWLFRNRGFPHSFGCHVHYEKRHTASLRLLVRKEQVDFVRWLVKFCFKVF